MPHVVFVDALQPSRLKQIAEYLPEGWTLATAREKKLDAQLEALQGADFAVTGDSAIPAEMMALPSLKAVHKWGVGYDNIDCEAAKAHGVRVLRTTGSNAVAVAETSLGLMLALQRNIVPGHVGVLNGKWRKGELSPLSRTMSGKTVGIIGLGYIGKALSRLLKGFGCPVLYTKRSRLDPAEEQELGVTYVSLDELLKTSDVVSLHCELNEQTRGMINAETLRQMKPDAILINAARGGVVVENDLADAIEANVIRGAGVDVFATEPVEEGNRLVGLDRVIVTPHVGAISADSFPSSMTRILGNLKCVLDGVEPPALDVVV